MLDMQSLESLMACERLKDEAAAVEQLCETILRRFDNLGREPTIAERDARRQDYIDTRARLSALNSEIDAITRRFGTRH